MKRVIRLGKKIIAEGEGKPFTLTFKTDELLEMFDLPDIELDPTEMSEIAGY